MIEEATLRRRVAVGVRHRDNWWQLGRFATVGASGYVVNLAVFAVCFELLAIGHRLAAAAAFLAGVTNNFFWNRHWTFRAGGGHAGFQAARFFTVSLVAFLFSLVVLELLVRAGLPEVAAQASAVVCAMPVNFVGNRLWSFRLHS